LDGELAISEDEDCLYLRVYVPKVTGDEPLPVMFWIFGGGYSLGDSDEFGWYDGKHLALKRNVIVVAVNYRVGVFGFAALPAAEAADGVLGNMGLLDQRAGMEWTRRNIAAFGGDPNRITIFGESAGGFSVCWHLASRGSRGLFQRAIMESGSCDSPQFFRARNDSLSFTHLYASAVGCNDTDPAQQLGCMQSKSVNDLMKSVADWLNPNWPFSTSDLSRQQVRSHFKSTLGIDSPVAGGYLPALAPIMPWGATVDGSSDGLLAVPLASIKQGDFARVPTIFGTNMNEGSIFIPMLPLVKKGAHFPPTDQDLVSVLAQVFEMYTPSAVQKVIPDIMTQ
jgi:carboxylesterase type B